MKKVLTAAVLATAATGGSAQAGGFVGLTYNFGSEMGVGLTAQVTSTRKEDHGFAAAGVSFFPFSPAQKVGVPVGLGYQGNNVAGIVSYDLLLKGFAGSVGYANTRDDTVAPIVVD